MAAPSTESTPPRASAIRWFGRLQLLRLLGKSARSMAWRVSDPRSGQELMLVLPRVQPADAAALERWQQAVRQASRLNHPQLAAVVEVGVQDGWPYVAYDPRDASTLAECLSARGMAGADAANWAGQLLQGLAYAHEAGIAHHDIQPFLALVSEGGQLRIAGLAVAAEMAQVAEEERQRAAVDTSALRSQRAAAERDVLAAGLLLYQMISGRTPLDEPDLGQVMLRLPPVGREIVRLPWTTTQPVAEPLRAIVNRATDRQERQRYRSARTLLRALEGWLHTEGGASGALVLLADRLRTAGVLPSFPGAAARAARLALMERERTIELAEVVLEDVALSFEMLRLVNAAQARGAQLSGSGPVLTIRRAIAMLGLDGVRRAALALRPWPGPLDDAGAAELQRVVERCQRAGRLALALRPPAYEAEVVYLVTLLQGLGRLVVTYHFPEEATQIRRLMQPAPALREGEPEDPGMTEESAAFAVLGADVEAIGLAVARHWGLDDSVLPLMRRQPLATPVRNIESDDDLLRALASCGHEVVDALTLPPSKVVPALQRVVTRYGRVLDFDLRELQSVLQGSPLAAVGTAPTAPAPLDGLAERLQDAP
jgi:non-specific serine/threonine protein kinase